MKISRSTRSVARNLTTAACFATVVVTAVVTSAGAASASSPALTPGAGAGAGFCATQGTSNDGDSFDNVYACKNYNIYDAFGYQCTELSNRFEWAVYGKLPAPAAAGRDLVSALHAQDGIAMDSNAPGHLPVAGDVISMWGDAGTEAVGHTAVVTAVNVSSSGVGTITTMGENDTPNGVNHITLAGWNNWHVNSGYYYYTHFQWTVQAGPLSYRVTSQSIVATAGDGTSAQVAPAAAATASWLGEAGRLSVTVQNTGADTWGPGGDNVSLGTAGPNDRASLLYSPNWLSTNRPAAVTTTVPPGGTYTFSFPFTIDASGTPVPSLTEHFNLVHELVAWFPDTGPTFSFGITSRVDRGLAFVHSGAAAGYTVDPDGTVRSFGGTPSPTGYATWAGWDIARGIVVRPNGTSGYTLDGFGGLHPFGGAPAVTTTAYWSGWDIARGIVLRADGASGYVLDGFGGLHPFGGAPAVTTTAYWSGWDIARALTLTSATGGYVLDGFGGLHTFGSTATPTAPSAEYTSGWDRAKAIGVTSSGTSGAILDGLGLRYGIS